MVLPEVESSSFVEAFFFIPISKIPLEYASSSYPLIFEVPSFNIEFYEDCSTIEYVILKETTWVVLKEFDEFVEDYLVFELKPSSLINWTNSFNFFSMIWPFFDFSWNSYTLPSFDLRIVSDF